jgi:hypothetical protein
MHGADFRKGAGGFLSGYRYLIRSLITHFREIDLEIAYPSLLLSYEDTIVHAVHRVQTAADLIIMQEGVVLRDVILPAGSGKYRYYEGVPYLNDERFLHPDAVYVYFAWGQGRGAREVFDSHYRYSDTLKLINMFLHPIVETKGLVRHVHEDLEMAWNSEPYIDVLNRVITQALEGNSTMFAPWKSLTYQLSTRNQTDEADDYETADLDAPMEKAVFDSIMLAVVYPSVPRYVQVHTAMKKWLPHLFANRK